PDEEITLPSPLQARTWTIAVCPSRVSSSLPLAASQILIFLFGSFAPISSRSPVTIREPSGLNARQYPPPARLSNFFLLTTSQRVTSMLCARARRAPSGLKATAPG